MSEVREGVVNKPGNDSGNGLHITSSKKLKSLAIILIKLALFSLIALFVFHKINIREMFDHISLINPVYIAISFLMLCLAQVVSAFRMKYYFATAGYRFSNFFSVAIYFVGTLYNNILPGGIGGDGYKAFYFKKNLGIPARKSLQLMLSERASGLLFLCIYAIIFGFFSILKPQFHYIKYFLFVSAIFIIPAYFTSVKLFLREKISVAIGAAKFSLISQGVMILCAYAIIMGIGIEGNISAYISVFMISCVVAILPVSIGSAGIRELSFVMASTIVEIDREAGVALAIIYFAVNFFSSLAGIVFLKRL